MNSNFIDCKLLAQQQKEKTIHKVKLFTEKFGKKPCLAIVLANKNDASKIYIKRKIKEGEECGIKSLLFDSFSEQNNNNDVIDTIKKLNDDENVHGIIVQLPLYEHMEKFLILNAVSGDKDVDGFTYVNQGKIMSGFNVHKAIIPATAMACHLIANSVHDSLEGLNCLVIGTSIIVGRPTALLMLSSGATVTIANSKTKDLKSKCLLSDIIISATGIPSLIKPEMIRPNTTIIDVGIKPVFDSYGNRKVVGDVDFEGCSKVTKKITPVPNGVGLLTVAFLLENVVSAAFLQEESRHIAK